MSQSLRWKWKSREGVRLLGTFVFFALVAPLRGCGVFLKLSSSSQRATKTIRYHPESLSFRHYILVKNLTTERGVMPCQIQAWTRWHN
ncbi:MAG TPA: hypothetical protein EYP71_07690 [Dehalococcoidia bacterium]|nr:hypothetical protein [Dehalococcoidia bacterium]